ncbi:MAG TPA: Ig-like domain repeat protein, partial [Gemmataceae bacterium]|nr:Ig-like domain repeat protein [Gemmataceae bacterium]
LSLQSGNPITIQADPTQSGSLATILSAVNGLQLPSAPITLTADLAGGTYTDQTANPPSNVTLVIQNGTLVGASPALTVSGGQVEVLNCTLSTATDAPTILLTGGSLSLRGDIVQESTAFTDAAINVTGGTLDLGTAVSPGANVLNINGAGEFVHNTTAIAVSAVGDTFESNGSPLAASTLSFAALTTSTTTTIPGQPVMLTATVRSNTPGSGTPTGSVDFLDTTTNVDLGTVALSGGVATLGTSALAFGNDVIVATYSGDATFLTSLDTLTQTVTNSIYILDKSANGALTLSGNAGISIPGNLVVDSNSKTALTESGNAKVTAGSIQVVGSVQESGTASLSPAASTGVSFVPNPLASLSGPSTTGLTNYGSVSFSGNGSFTLNPGIYKQISVSGNASVTLNSGLYLIEGGGLTVSGNVSLSGTDIMIYNTSSTYPNANGSYGGITLSGYGTFSLTAPTTTANGVDAGILIFQPTANTRALSLSGNGLAGVSGTVYAPSAQVVLSGNAQLGGSLVADELSISGNGVSTQVAGGAAGSELDGGSSGTLLAGNLYVYVSDPAGYFTANELNRIQDAINTWNSLLAPYSVTISEVTDSSLANVTIDDGTSSGAGSAADGVLGCYSSTGEITILQGWNWYDGADATQIGSNQYDFETVMTHELGHALGLGGSNGTNSPMNEILAAGVARRTPTAADLNIPAEPDGADAEWVAPPHAPTVGASGPASAATDEGSGGAGSAFVPEGRTQFAWYLPGLQAYDPKPAPPTPAGQISVPPLPTGTIPDVSSIQPALLQDGAYHRFFPVVTRRPLADAVAPVVAGLRPVMTGTPPAQQQRQQPLPRPVDPDPQTYDPYPSPAPVQRPGSDDAPIGSLGVGDAEWFVNVAFLAAALVNPRESLRRKGRDLFFAELGNSRDWTPENGQSLT